MSYHLEIRDKALEEIDESYGYYEEQKTGLGDNFTKDVFKTIGIFKISHYISAYLIKIIDKIKQRNSHSWLCMNLKKLQIQLL